MRTTRTKTAQIEAEYNRLIAIFSGLEQNKLELAEKQVKQLAWYNISIAELHKSIDKNGTSVEYGNGGGQFGTHKNPDIEVLKVYQTAANTICGNLIKLLGDIPPKGFDVDDWLERSYREPTQAEIEAEKERQRKINEDIERARRIQEKERENQSNGL